MPGPGYYFIGEEERANVLKTLDANSLNRYSHQGDRGATQWVSTLERNSREYFGVSYALAVTSGTAALNCALRSLPDDLKGGEVIVPGFCWIAVFTSVLRAGFIPVLAEIDSSLTMDIEDVTRKISEHTVGILAVHMLGNPCRIQELRDLCEEHSLFLLEDCAQAFGARVDGVPVGNFGIAGCYSFNVYKMITGGEGGLLTTFHKGVYTRAFVIHDPGVGKRQLGKVFDEEVFDGALIGDNYRMNELTGAVIVAQLKKIDTIRIRLSILRTRITTGISLGAGVHYKTINGDDCPTLLTLIFDDQEHAATVARRMGTATMDSSGVHVYKNMHHLKPYGIPDAELPLTDSILSRAVSFSIGVFDKGLGAGVGITPDMELSDVDVFTNTLQKSLFNR